MTADPLPENGPKALESVDRPGGHAPDRYDLPFDPVAGDVVVRRLGERPGGLAFNIPRRHIHHSPSGWEVGYAGSGPADFALNILALYLPVARGAREFPAARSPGAEKVPLGDGTFVSRAAWDLHQSFKLAFVATLPLSGGTIRGEQIRRWLRLRGHEPPARVRTLEAIGRRLASEVVSSRGHERPVAAERERA